MLFNLIFYPKNLDNLLVSSFFLGNFSDNCSDGVDGISKYATADQCIKSYIHFFNACDWYNITISDSIHCNNCPIQRIYVSNLPMLLIELFNLQPSVCGTLGDLHLCYKVKCTTTEMCY